MGIRPDRPRSRLLRPAPVQRPFAGALDLAAGTNRVKLSSVGNNGANIDVLKIR